MQKQRSLSFVLTAFLHFEIKDLYKNFELKKEKHLHRLTLK